MINLQSKSVKNHSLLLHKNILPLPSLQQNVNFSFWNLEAYLSCSHPTKLFPFDSLHVEVRSKAILVVHNADINFKGNAFSGNAFTRTTLAGNVYRSAVV